MHKHSKRPFVVEMHDLCPDTLPCILDDLRALRDFGIARVALGVIPGRFDPEADRAAADALLELRSEGHEILIHGFSHRADSRVPRDWVGRLIVRLTRGEAEFAGLDGAQMAVLLEDAIRRCDQLGLGRASGFVAPTWWAGTDLPDLVWRAGWSMLEERFWLHYRESSPRIMSFPWSAAGLPGVSPGLIWKLGALFGGVIPGLPRLVLHPGDTLGNSGRALSRLIRSWLKWGSPVLFGDIVP